MPPTLAPALPNAADRSVLMHLAMPGFLFGAFFLGLFCLATNPACRRFVPVTFATESIANV